MTRSRWDQLRNDAGGPWLASPVTVAYLAPAMLVMSVLFSLLASNGVLSLTGLVANTVAFALVIGLLLVLRSTLFRKRNTRPVALWIVLVTGASLGIVKAFTTNALISWPNSLELTSSALWGRTISAALIGLLYLPAMSIILAARERFRLERSVLISEVVQAEARRAASSLSPEKPLGTENDAALKAFIAETTVRLDHAAEGTVNASETLLDIVDSALRPLSHKIWQEQNAKYTDFSMRDLAKIAMQEHRFSVPLIWLAFTFSCLSFLIQQAGVEEGIFRLVLALTLIALILGAATRVKTTSPRLGFLIFWGAIVLLCVAIELVSTGLLGPLQPGQEMTFGIIDFLFFSTVALIFGCIQVALASSTTIRAQLAPFLGTAGIDRHRAIVSLQYNRDMAHYLHSEVQNHMLASALRIEHSQISGDPIDLKAEMRSISDALTQAHASIGPQPGRVGTLDRELGILSRAWFKTIDLRFDLVGDATTWNSQTVVSVSRLLDEVITNAVRHGLATEVRISIDSATPGEIALVSLDNGVLKNSAPPGLGSALYTTMAGANWSLTRDPISDRTRLELLIDTTPNILDPAAS